MRIHNLYEDEHGQSHGRDIEVEWTEQTVGVPVGWQSRKISWFPGKSAAS